MDVQRIKYYLTLRTVSGQPLGLRTLVDLKTRESAFASTQPTIVKITGIRRHGLHNVPDWDTLDYHAGTLSDAMQSEFRYVRETITCSNGS